MSPKSQDVVLSNKQAAELKSYSPRFNSLVLPAWLFFVPSISILFFESQTARLGIAQQVFSETFIVLYLSTVSIFSMLILSNKSLRDRHLKEMNRRSKKRLKKKMLEMNRVEKEERLRKALGSEKAVDNYIFIVKKKKAYKRTMETLLLSELNYGEYATKASSLIELMNQDSTESIDSVMAGIEELYDMEQNHQAELVGEGVAESQARAEEASALVRNIIDLDLNVVNSLEVPTQH